MDHTSDPLWAAKLALRDQITTARGRLGVAEIARRAEASTDHLLADPVLRRAATVAGYISVGREPGTTLLLERLRARGVRVIVPRLLPDDDLEWATYEGADAVASARRGLLEPFGPSLGVEAIATADVVIAPALALDGAGHRLGRGGGSFDRALARATGATLGLVNSEEVLAEVPTAIHDLPVHGIATEEGVRWLGRG